MSKNELLISLALGLGLNFFILMGGITSRIVPYWAASFISNALGLFIGFVLAGAVSSYLERNKHLKRK